MFETIKKLINHLYNNNVIRYIFFGGLTTLVNVVSYFLLRNIIELSVNTSNIISIILAIIFAYIVNSRYVFQSKAQNKRERFHEFLAFIGARISTMVIEVVGVFVFVELISMDDMLAKILIQFIVLVLNYLLSKLVVFK